MLFFYVWQFYERQVRMKTAERVVEELNRLDEPCVLLVDKNFLRSPKRAERIALLIKRIWDKKTLHVPS
ncbi:MAG: hypothetical protein NZ583_03270 [Desulfobacterota bacterium]|nr:hypothetical protein [Thermodesulfobacteriota bacterium]MDW8001907.1 hypothetical protein [Deltaproteobacteria bacterium]